MHNLNVKCANGITSRNRVMLVNWLSPLVVLHLLLFSLFLFLFTLSLLFLSGYSKDIKRRGIISRITYRWNWHNPIEYSLCADTGSTMTAMLVKVTWVILLIFQLRASNSIAVRAQTGSFCRLENRTVTLNICKNPPRFVLPICVGYCPSSTRWEFRLNRFVARTSTCTVTQHRTEHFTCPDATHTTVEILIPLACSCEKHYCQNRSQNHPL